MILRYFSTVRPECSRLRKYLIEKYTADYGGCHCSMCLLNLPTNLLDMAHLKPRHVLTHPERKNHNCVELMCKMCHSIYDNGFLGVNECGILETKLIHCRLPIFDKIGHIYSKYCIKNSHFFEWHYKYVYRKMV